MEKEPKPKNKHQIAAEKRYEKIICAAKRLFLEKGFAGTSMGAISKASQTNQSLIYHYFPSKEELWIATKEHILKNLQGDNDFDPHTCKTPQDFIKKSLEQRFQLVQEQPDMARLMLWQRLEKQTKPLISQVKTSSAHWPLIIEKFQNRGLIKKEVKPKHLTSLMVNGFFAVVTDNAYALDTRTQKENLDFLIKNLTNYACL